MTEGTQAQPARAVDLRLRGEPPRVMRLSRKTLAAAGLVLATGIGGALIYALQPPTGKTATELYQTDSRAAAESVAGGPKDYTQVPRFGPPLPGDLGKPILSAQQRGVEIAPPAIGTPPATPPPVDRVSAARERALQERDAARTSKMFVAAEARDRSAASPPEVPALVAASATATAVPLSDQQSKQSFLHTGDIRPTESGFRLAAPTTPYLVQAGSVIPAALITGVRSDLPGAVTAQVTQNVFDSVTGRYLLIPQGSRLVGEYDSQISFGQNRVLLAWDRLILPDGRSVQLDRLPGSDLAGHAGLEDQVNQHWGGMLRAALISTLLGIGTEVGAGSDDDLINAIRQGSAESMGRTGQDLVRRQMNVQPTLTIRPGFQLRIMVTRDLVLAPVEGVVR